MQSRIGPALEALEGDAAPVDHTWSDLLSTANEFEASLADVGPDGRPLADRVRRRAGQVRAAVDYVRSAAALRRVDPERAAQHLRGAQGLLAPLRAAD